MQRGRADARQLSSAVSTANNGTSPGRLIPPCWNRRGERVLQPPAPWPPACLLCAQPLPVDLSALGDEANVPLRRSPGNSKAIRLPLRERVSAWTPADSEDLTSTVAVTPTTQVVKEGRARRLRLQLKESWERIGPAVKVRRGLKSTEPYKPIALANSEAEFDEVGILVHERDLGAW